MAVIVGAGAGYLASRIPVSAVLRYTLAAMAAYLAGTCIQVLQWLVRATSDSGVAAVSVDIRFMLMVLVLALVLSGVTHAALAWLGVPLEVQRYVPLLLGMLCALLGVLTSTPRPRTG